MNIVVALILLIIAVGLFFAGRNSSKHADAYGLYVEASKPSELSDSVPGYFGGTVTTVDGQPPLTTPYSQQACVYMSSNVEDLVTTQDSEGRTSNEWQQVSSSQPEYVLFSVRQQSGDYVLVSAADADAQHIQERETFIEAPQVQGVGVGSNLINTFTHLQGPRRRATEHFIPVGSQCYVGGMSTEQNGIRTFSQDAHYPLVLSELEKQQLVKSEKGTSLIMYVATAVFVAAAGVAFVLIK